MVSTPPRGKKGQFNKWYYWAGGGVALVVVYVEYKKAKTNSAATTAATTTAATDTSIDPSTGIPYAQEAGGVDPSTGLPYSSEDYSGVVGTTPSAYTYTDPTTGATIGNGSYVSGPSTNAAWAQQVEAYLASIGYDQTTVSAAIGKYLTGGALTSDQYGIVQTAVGYEGSPPTPVPAPQIGAPTGQTQSSSNNAQLAALRATYDALLAYARGPNAPKDAKSQQALNAQIAQAGAAYQAALKAVNASSTTAA
jgi:hypothetical protein